MTRIYMVFEIWTISCCVYTTWYVLNKNASEFWQRQKNVHDRYGSKQVYLQALLEELWWVGCEVDSICTFLWLYAFCILWEPLFVFLVLFVFLYFVGAFLVFFGTFWFCCDALSLGGAVAVGGMWSRLHCQYSKWPLEALWDWSLRKFHIGNTHNHENIQNRENMQNHQKRQKYQKGKTQQYPNQACEKIWIQFCKYLTGSKRRKHWKSETILQS